MEFIIGFVLALQKYAVVLFLISLGASYLGRHQFSRGKRRLGYQLILGAAIAASLLCGSYAIVALATRHSIFVLLAALWGYIAFRDWQRVRIIRPQL